jgi:predicted Rossmann fold flavoprotein
MPSSPASLKIAVIGGGAAGFFAALAAAEENPRAVVTLYEATAHPLAKVRISGGGRCNVTHACFEPRELVQRYPRGARELLGPFHRFGPRETVDWFAQRGVALKTEADGRMFPVTDLSSTVTDCLLQEAERRGVRLRVRCSVQRALVNRTPTEVTAGFELELSGGEVAPADRLIVATGGNRGSTGLSLAAAFGHTIEPPVPSLFTFHLDDSRLRGLEGVSVPSAQVSVPGTRLRESGPMLITHWGLSGPAVLRLSAWGARELARRSYAFPLQVAWVAPLTVDQAAADLAGLRSAQPRRLAANANPWDLPSRLWERLLLAAGVPATAVWTTLSNQLLQALARQVVAGEFTVAGKSMNKEEFVTCGGVRLREVDFRSMESRRRRDLFFAGEVLDVDGITGGFNFQAAWTTGWIAGRAAAGGAM